ncbi:MAG: creatininase family protein [Thaumarchaeota archaeon]|nr:MAG: creatininase family protein [Nitrososphaerota archaeon]
MAREIDLGGVGQGSQGLTVLVLPTLNFGVSWYHRNFSGSVWLSPGLFVDVVVEICKSLTKHGYVRKVIVNCHGGNAATLTVAINRFYEETGERVLLAQWWEVASDVLKDMMVSGLIHAEEAETSLALALGQRVLMEKASRDAFDRGKTVRERGYAWSRHAKYDATFKGGFVNPPMDMIDEISQSGVVGDSTLATKEKGTKILDTLITRLLEVCEDLGRQSRRGATR